MTPSDRPESAHVYRFFSAVVLTSAPLWWIASRTDWEPLPGLPASALMALVPGPVALALVWRAAGRGTAVRWLVDAVNPGALRSARWVLVALLTPPAMLVLAYVAMLLGGHRFPPVEIGAASAVMLLALFLIPALFEELGWSSFALVGLQRRMSALGASVLIGSVWAAWHFIPLLQAGRPTAWIAWWSVTTVALRIVITWVFNSTSGSAILAALFHASENASWQSFPNRGSDYDPAVHAVVLGLLCVVIVLRFGARTLEGSSG